MLNLAGLRAHRELIAAIDWEITPRQAFEAYQLKSTGNWRHGSLSPVVYFMVSCWRGENKVVLVRRSLKQSEDLAEIQAPPAMVEACCARWEGEMIPRGQAPLSDELRDWLQTELAPA